MVLLKVTKTNSDYDSTDGKGNQSGEKNEVGKAPAKKSSKNDVKLTKIMPLRDGPVVSFQEGKSKTAGFSSLGPRTDLSGSDPAKRTFGDPPASMAEQNGKAKYIKNIYTGFELSKVIKMEQTSQPR